MVRLLTLLLTLHLTSMLHLTKTEFARLVHGQATAAARVCSAWCAACLQAVRLPGQLRLSFAVTGLRMALTDSTASRYVKFDTYHPAVDRGLPVTRVISRTTLQRILAEAVMELAGENVIQNGVKVVGFEDVRPCCPSLVACCCTAVCRAASCNLNSPSGTKVNLLLWQCRTELDFMLQVKVGGRDQIAAVTADGQKITGDILIGADGISSKVWLAGSLSSRTVLSSTLPAQGRCLCKLGRWCLSLLPQPGADSLPCSISSFDLAPFTA